MSIVEESLFHAHSGRWHIVGKIASLDDYTILKSARDVADGDVDAMPSSFSRFPPMVQLNGVAIK